MTTILIVDDHDLFRADARDLLESAGYEVIGEAADAAHGLTQATLLEPDVVLLDVQLPDDDGFSVARQIAAGPHPPRVVLVSSREAVDYGRQLRSTPAAGFIHKPDLSRASLAQVLGAA